MPHQPHTLAAAQGTFVLHRLPHRPREVLRAWDAADEYVLNTLADLPPPTRLLIVNDTFGALVVAMNQLQPHAFSDSHLSHQATRLNLRNNHLPEPNGRLLASLDPLEGMFDCVVMKVPKTLALLEDQLIRISQHVHAATKFIVAGMIKAMPATVWTLLERLIGPTHTQLAWKKARLIIVTVDNSLKVPANPYPMEYLLENTEYRLSNHANVFSRERLDIGTRFFLEHLPINPNATHIIDLACGNGVVGLIAAKRNPGATLYFVDESFMAVASACTNFRRAFGEKRAASFQLGDGLSDFPPRSADMILCNPPFHQQNTMGDQVALQLFRQAKNVLRIGGELWVVGNRHLNYPLELRRLFGHCELVAGNAKFVILRAVA
ncbi:MAG: 50S rRNA methyltransferase [Deltaproteobacteria bacterium HGW-Deltaproteobacteria-22]|jgi:16S rRNA (guanine1207-N2)-methyltransferase|nr:MAG: 50S rRNA methyltransferase [Deltaproteobacteria bacterium HGW-Deltaproteobacteria-22]